MAPVELVTESTEVAAIAGKTSNDISKPLVGIIYPPPEVRNIVDKTASFVARNGPEFEARIRQNEIQNPKFNFLNGSDPYHAYYDHKVSEFAEGRAQETMGMRVMAPSMALAPTSLGGSVASLGLGSLDISGGGGLSGTGAGSGIKSSAVDKMKESFVPREPPPECEYTNDPPSINALDLDIVKLTAQFVARNGRQFLTQLMNREQRNFQFDFLRPQHSLFNYFTKLVEQYTKILIPPKDMISRLQRQTEHPAAVLKQVGYRSEWHQWQERLRRREEEAAERERVAYALIDWHDFVVVETVDFQPNETGNFPPPTTPQEVGARVLQEERSVGDGGGQASAASANKSSGAAAAASGAAKSAADDMEQSSDEEDEDAVVAAAAVVMQKKAEQAAADAEAGGAPPPPPPPISLAPPLMPPSQMIIRRDYDPKAPRAATSMPGAPGALGGSGGAAAGGLSLVSPITGEAIPANQVAQHMRIGLLDPKWMEQRDRELNDRRDNDTVFALGGAVESSLKHLAERRTDIFGVGTDEVRIGRKLGEQEEEEEEEGVRETAAWDGHSVTRDLARTRAQQATAAKDKEAAAAASAAAAAAAVAAKMALQAQQAPPKPAPPPPPAAAVPSMPLVPPGAVHLLQPPHALLHQGGPPVAFMQVPPGAVVGGGPPPQFAVPPPGLPPMHLAPTLVQPPVQPPPRMPPMLEEPASKRAKTEDNLIPEEVFLRQHAAQDPVSVKVSVPARPDKPEFRLAGQILTLSLPLRDTVAVLKSKLADQLLMPGSKQKLAMDGLFLKDNQSLAYYNMVNGSLLQLQLKERGGRKQ